jgi:hypothetical protein
MDQCATQVLAFNLNTLADSKNRPLVSLLLSQYYVACGYSGNLIYARVIEAELDKQGKLSALHAAVEARAKKPWADILKNPTTCPSCTVVSLRASRKAFAPAI